MVRLGCFLALFTVATAWDDSNFLDWFSDELRETVDEPIVWEGTVPSYLAGGTFVQTGPARFGFGKYKFTHMLDGYSKVNTLKFAKDGSTTYTTQFLASAFMNRSIKTNRIARGMFVGEVEPNPHWGPTAVAGSNDNNYIKMRRIGDQDMILADVMIATEIAKDHTSFKCNVRDQFMGALVPGVKWDDKLTPLGDMCMLGTMAHGPQNAETGVFTGGMGCFGVRGNYHIVFNIEPSAPTTRKLIAKIHLPKGRNPSYMHAMGSTPNYVILAAEPLYMSLPAVLGGKSLGKGGLKTSNDPTIFHVVNRETGDVRNLEAPGFIYGHILNSFEDGEDIVMDFTWSAAGNATTLGWMNRWRLEYMGNPAIRESWPRTKIVRYRLKANNSVEKMLLFADENGEDDFETPKINEEFDGKKYCIVYMIQFHSYEYDKDQNSTKGGPFGAVGLAKRNLCTGERQGLYMPNMYPSEVQFVRDPQGKAEDDGALISMVFDGNTNKSFVQILDARSFKRVAKADLPIKFPFLIHGTWFPETQADLEISV